MPDGKLYFSDKLCGDINKIEVVRDKTPITEQQRREAHRVAAQRNRELGAIEYEKAALAAERAAEQRQLESASLYEKRVKNIQDSTVSPGMKARLLVDAAEGAPASVREKVAKDIGDMKLSPGRKAQYLLDVANTGKPGGEQRIERRRLEAEAEANSLRRAQQQQQQQIQSQKPQPSVFYPDKGGGWDDQGNRYNGSPGGTTFRSDGKICQSVGATVQCN